MVMMSPDRYMQQLAVLSKAYRLMSTRLHQWLLILLCSVITFPVHAALNAYVDRNPVAMDESFKLIIESDRDVTGEPDFNQLRADFDVLGQSNSTNIQIINGATSRKTQWFVTLIPKHAGTLTIPAFKIDGQSSAPLTVNITAAQQRPSAQQGAELFLQVEANPKQAYVQQQVIYTVRLYHSVNLAGGSRLSEPEFPDGNAIVKRLGEDREFQTAINGVRYAVIERKYLIFPQKSGQFTIDPLVFDGQVVDQQRNGGFMFSPFNQSTHHKRVRSPKVDLDILAAPAGVVGSHWLPASDLQLVEEWSETPPKFKVGEPITRTIAIIADGLTSAQLPEINVNLPDHVKGYPDKVVLKDNEDNRGVTGIRQQKIALIPTQPGTLIIPEISINWWNTETGKMAVARLAQQQVIVTGSAQAQTAVETTPVPSQPSAANDTSETGTESIDATVPVSVTDQNVWRWITFGLALGWFATVLGWWIRSRTGRQQQHNSADVKHEGLGKSERQLRQACMSNDASGVRSALLQWTRIRWGETTAPTSLPALARQCPQDLSEALLQLDSALYSDRDTSWSGEGLWQLFQQYKPEPKAVSNNRASGLEPLHQIGTA